MTAMPCFASSRAVPPVDRISTPRACRLRAKSTMPSLSDTLSSARVTGRIGRPPGSVL